MIEYKKFQLENGLRVLLHKDPTTPLAVVNVLYDVGARDEQEDKTGFAHLFEHLMFGGSVNIPEFDSPLQDAGGENNAFTSNDITNYYDVLPLQNLETALWLESDRMLSLAFTPKSLEVQRSVVIEEFKQRYLNQPYGDVWLELRPLAYSVHPYKWATIGKEISHIEEATMDDVKSFFNTFYHPANAILCVAGNIEFDETLELISKWFGSIPAQPKNLRNLPQEPEQKEFRSKNLVRDVPSKAFYYAFKMVDRNHADYYTCDVISDILGQDKSARLFLKLKKELQIVADINAYITGSIDKGLLIISGKLNDGRSFEELEAALWPILDQLSSEEINEKELKKVLNKIRTSKAFQEQGILNRAMNLCYYELLGDANEINRENEHYKAIRSSDIKRVSAQMFKKENCSLLTVTPSENAK
jgi:zinc protease